MRTARPRTRDGRSQPLVEIQIVMAAIVGNGQTLDLLITSKQSVHGVAAIEHTRDVGIPGARIRAPDGSARGSGPCPSCADDLDRDVLLKDVVIAAGQVPRPCRRVPTRTADGAGTRMDTSWLAPNARTTSATTSATAPAAWRRQRSRASSSRRSLSSGQLLVSQWARRQIDGERCSNSARALPTVRRHVPCPGWVAYSARLGQPVWRRTVATGSHDRAVSSPVKTYRRSMMLVLRRRCRPAPRGRR